MRIHVRVALFALVALSDWPLVRWPYLLMRNMLLSGPVPMSLPPRYGCPGLEHMLTVVMTAKDTCSQAPAALVHLATSLPLKTTVVYHRPTFENCDAVDLAAARIALPALQIVDAPPDASPVDGFVRSLEAASTPFVLLMHNDVYAMDVHSICELVGAALSRPHESVFAPQLYEREATGIITPHAHQSNLRNASTGMTFDMDVDLLLKRWPSDFAERAQPDFLEDHVYLVRTNVPAFLDPRASYTYEFVDNVLALRTLGIVPHYVPTARFLFDVDPRKVSWHDVAYLAEKRSEARGHATCRYLSAKWGATFHPSGVWNYVRASYMWSVTFEAAHLPSEWQRQKSLYHAWFLSIGYSDVDEGWESAAHGAVASRRIASVTSGVHPISLPTSWLPITTAYSRICTPDHCGMLVVDADGCHCWTYEPPFDLDAVAPLERAFDMLRLPARALRFEAMRWGLRRELRWGAARRPQSGTTCPADEACATTVPPFGKEARLVKWAWRKKTHVGYENTMAAEEADSYKGD